MVTGNGISITGLGSGIDTASLIQKLVQLESQGKVHLQAQQSNAQSKLSTFAQLKTLVQTLHDKADGLSLTSKFLHLKGETSRDGVLSFEVSSSAQKGSHSITVQQLAATDRWAFDGVTDPATSLATAAGQITFTVGAQNYSVPVAAATSSLNEIASAINQQASAAVEATVVNVGTTSAPSWKLVLASKQSGADGRIHGLSSTVTGLSVDGTEPAANSTTPVSANQLVVGQNAKALVDGLQVERTTNEFSGALAGVTFTAQSADPLKPVQLTISPDGAAIQSALQDFIDAYNAVVSFTSKQNTFSKDGGAGGPLFGDSATSLVNSAIHSALFNVPTSTITSDTQGYSTLGLVGLNLQRDGTIVIDQSKLQSKITGDVGKLADLFAGSGSGLAATLVQSINQLIDPGVGVGGIPIKSVFGAKEDSLQTQITQLDKRIAAEDFRLGQYEAELRARFANLEKVMASLNSQTSALTALTANNK